MNEDETLTWDILTRPYKEMAREERIHRELRIDIENTLKSFDPKTPEDCKTVLTHTLDYYFDRNYLVDFKVDCYIKTDHSLGFNIYYKIRHGVDICVIQGAINNEI